MALGKTKKRLGDMLIEEGLITGEQLDKALKVSKESGKRLGETLVESGAVSDVDIMSTLSRQLGIQAVSLIGVQIPEELLKLLMTNAGIVTTRELILDRVWGIDFEGESRTLDMHIKTLRQKLKEEGSLIKTVRNVGYIMNGEKA